MRFPEALNRRFTKLDLYLTVCVCSNCGTSQEARGTCSKYNEHGLNKGTC